MEVKKLNALGYHLLIEFEGVDNQLLDDHKKISELLINAAVYAKATVVESVFHRFNPYGVSGVVVIAESHLSIHTWPEYGYAAIDVFTCGDDVDPSKCYEYLLKEMAPRKYRKELKKRGVGAVNSKRRIE